MMLGKRIDTCVAYAQQMDKLISATEDELIIIFSYTASYFDYPDLREHRDVFKRPRIWMVCGNTENVPSCVDEVLLFASKRDQLSHPYQLEAVASLLAQQYANHYYSES